MEKFLETVEFLSWRKKWLICYYGLKFWQITGNVVDIKVE